MRSFELGKRKARRKGIKGDCKHVVLFVTVISDIEKLRLFGSCTDTLLLYMHAWICSIEVQNSAPSSSLFPSAQHEINSSTCSATSLGNTPSFPHLDAVCSNLAEATRIFSNL